MTLKRKKSVKKMDQNFLELKTVDEANIVDPKKYTLIKLSDTRGYCFKKRAGK